MNRQQVNEEQILTKTVHLQEPIGKKPVKILFIDHDVEFLKSAIPCLKLKGNYDVETASALDEALEKIERTQPDVIICDIPLPSENGLELLKALGEIRNLIPFIVFTLTAEKENAIKAYEWGASGFVGKFGHPEEIFSTLRKCIEEAVNKSKKCSEQDERKQ